MRNGSKCALEIKLRMTTENAACNQTKTSCTNKLDRNLMKKTVKCYVWSVALNGGSGSRPQIKYTWNVVKCGAGERWRRSIGPIV